MTETVTYAAALARINEWREQNDCSLLSGLPDLGTHCEQCGFPYTEKDLGGGRCLSCERSICAPPKIIERPEPEPTQRVYVLSYAPSYEEAADGGCEWRREWEGILEMLRDAEMITAGYDYRVITLDLPADMTAIEITDFLGSGNGVDVIDPPDPRQDLDDSLRYWRKNGEE